MAGIQSEIIILIDTSAFVNTDWDKAELMEHVKEAVSFQISRGAVTNRKLVQLGLEPYLARVKWTYLFFDSTHPSKAEGASVQTMKTLTYECWDLFKEELNREVKRNMTKDGSTCTSVPGTARVKNLIEMLYSLKFSFNWRGRSNSNPEDSIEGGDRVMSHSSPQIVDNMVIVFTTIPKIFSTLIHMANGINGYKRAIAPVNVKICIVDVSFDLMASPINNRSDDYWPCFWDDVCYIHYNMQQRQEGLLEERENPQQQQQQQQYAILPGQKINLRVSCLKKLLNIHKLMEMRFPIRFDQCLPFGFGMGMKRLRHCEWKIPHEEPSVKRSSCFSLRKCCSEEVYCDHYL